MWVDSASLVCIDEWLCNLEVAINLSIQIGSDVPYIVILFILEIALHNAAIKDRTES